MLDLFKSEIMYPTSTSSGHENVADDKVTEVEVQDMIFFPANKQL